MLFFIKSMVVLIAILLLANDVMFNKLRIVGLKIIEGIICIALIYYLFIDTTGYIIRKNEIETSLKENSVLGSPITVYDINGNVSHTITIGDFLYNAFVYDVLNTNSNAGSPEYIKNNIIVCVISAILLVYWIVLLLLFEKEEAGGYRIEADEKLFEKYNPMMASCIAQNRNVMCRDVIGVILNFINRGKINLRIVPDAKNKKSGYKYMLSKNENSDFRLDMEEREIYDMLFEGIEDFDRNSDKYTYISKNDEGVIEVDLIKRIKAFTQDEDAYARLKELNFNVKKRLNIIGANRESVPFMLRLFNNILICISIVIVASHIAQNGMDISITNLQMVYLMFVMIFAIAILPLIYVFSLICIEFIMTIFKTLKQVTEGFTGRQLIAKSVSIIFATFLLMIIYSLFAKDYYIIYDILLLGITCLIVFTDDFMLKHDVQILNDYYNLKRIEKKLEDYSLMEGEHVEYIELWNEYYAYAVALGIPMPVNKEIDSVYETTNMLSKENLEAIYYVSKSYLEVMWDMEFYDKKSQINLLKYLKY